MSSVLLSLERGEGGERVSRVICGKRRLLRKGHAKCTSGLVHCSGFSGLPRNSASSMCWTRLDAPFLFLSEIICTVLFIVNKLKVVETGWPLM